MAQIIKKGPSWMVRVTCRQRGLPTAGHFLVMATQPLSGMTGVWNITRKASPAGRECKIDDFDNLIFL
ncbi:hypothetical protein HCZ86_08850 [Limosilactobacillus fermentum]